MTVISITRELGTRGKDVADALAERRGLTTVNDELIEHDIAERTGMREAAVHRYFDGTANLLERWRTDSKTLSNKTAEEVYELALKGNVILRGWGAPFLLRDIPHALCVRICAPMATRQRVLVERGVAPDAGAARDLINRQDAANDGAMRRLFGADGKDASIFAMVLNTDRLSVEKCVGLIGALADEPMFQETAQSRRAIEDKLVRLRASAALASRFGTDHRFSQIDVAVADGHVRLTGVSTLDNANVIAAEIVRQLPGVTSVDGEITVMPYYRRHAA